MHRGLIDQSAGQGPFHRHGAMGPAVDGNSQLTQVQSQRAADQAQADHTDGTIPQALQQLGCGCHRAHLRNRTASYDLSTHTG